jgi:hypothetical protein
VICRICELPIVKKNGFASRSRTSWLPVSSGGAWAVDWVHTIIGDHGVDDLVWCAYGEHIPRQPSRAQVIRDLVEIARS